MTEDGIPRLALRALKKAGRWGIGWVDRCLHGRRRAPARETLEARAREADRVMFVCLGNICRSPYAAEVFRTALPESTDGRLEVGSTGFYPAEGRTSPETAVRTARRRGVDLADHRSGSLAVSPPSPSRRTETVWFVMEPGQRKRLRYGYVGRRDAVLILGDLDPEAVRRRGIRDPYGGDERVFEEVLDRIDRCVEEAVGFWRRGIGPGA